MPNCSEVMTRNPVCCEPGDSIEHVAQLIKNEDVGSLPVVDSLESMRLVGIVTDRDIAIRVVASGGDPALTTVESVMSSALATCRLNNDVHEAMQLMADYQIRRIPVVSGDGRIIGIISQADIATRLKEPSATGQIVEDISES